MKKLLSITLLSSLFPLPLSLFAMPLKWDCNYPEARAARFQIYQGESVTFEPTFHVDGKALNLEIDGIYYQTNGMGKAWWKLDGNTFTPENDFGASSYRFFVSASAPNETVYRANGTLVMLRSPGYKPTAADLPKEVFDFSSLDILNAPWPDKSQVDEALEASRDAHDTVGRIEEIVIGDDCQIVSTNYNSATIMPSLFLRFKIKDESTGEKVWYKVWDELTRFNYIVNEHLPTNYYNKAHIDAELEQKADRAWGFYDSATGNFAPEGFTWVSSPSIAIAGGLAYQRIATTEGAIWVLESNGMTTFTGGETNGYFRISDDKGNAIFEITKGTEKVVGATAGSVRTTTIDGKTHIFIDYNVQSSEHPKLEICRDLKALDWKTEGDSECAANVTWTGTSGAYTAEVWGKSVEKSLFVQATYKQSVKDMIKHSAPISFTEVVIDGVTFKVKVETINGKKVLVLE